MECKWKEGCTLGLKKAISVPFSSTDTDTRFSVLLPHAGQNTCRNGSTRDTWTAQC
jgi:hypothetical protein